MKLDKLRELVDEIYDAKHAGRGDWADWLYPNHVLWTANKSVLHLVIYFKCLLNA